MMTQPFDIPICESLDEFGWDPDEVRDLNGRTPLSFDEDDLPVDYEAEQFSSLEGAYLRNRFYGDVT